MRIFSWLSGNQDHHVNLKTGKRGNVWWMIVRDDLDGAGAAVERDVGNCPAPGFKSEDLAIEDARAFLDGIGADYLEIRS